MSVMAPACAVLLVKNTPLDCHLMQCLCCNTPWDCHLMQCLCWLVVQNAVAVTLEEQSRRIGEAWGICQQLITKEPDLPQHGQ